MNKERFQELITRPDAIESFDLTELQQVVRDYPAFHDAHLLLLYGLYKFKSDKFEDQLSRSSLCLSSRPFFVNAIFNGWIRQPIIDTPKVHETIEVVLEPKIEPVADLIIDTDTKEAEEVVVSNVVEFENEPVQDISEADQSEEIVVESHDNDTFTFSLEESQPIEATDKKDIEHSEKQYVASDLLELDMNSIKVEDEQSDDLIDHFLKVNPRIVPKLDLEDVRGDISQPGLEEDDEIVTETLANIYEQQGHFLKAKEAFQKLILKFPEKSTYFASRIQELEKRIK